VIKYKYLFSIVLFMESIQSVHAQYEGNYSIGIKGGITCSRISNTANILVSEDYYSNYSLDEKWKLGGEGGVFFNAKIPETIIAFQPEITYASKGSKLKYSDVYGLHYDVGFDYQYIQVGCMVKCYLWRGLNLEAGAQIGFNITPGSISYSSNGESLGLSGPDVETRDQMSQVIKGNTDFSVMTGLSYEFPFGFSIDARYLWGVSDAMTTENNTYRFVENSNHTGCVEVTVGYAYSYGEKSSHRRR
jgi:hypothetical protein